MTSPRSRPGGCDRCGQVHDPTRCQAHVTKDPTTREPIDPRQCGKEPMKDQRVCRSHGGSTRRAREAAERQRQQQEAQAVLQRIWNPDATPVTDSVGEMQRLAGSMRQAVDALGQGLDDPNTLNEVRATAWLRVLRELRTLLADMKRLGIAEYAVNVEAAKVKLMAVAFGRALDVLEPTAEQRERATAVLLAELKARAEIEGGEVA